jgi:hypothetical protein
MPRFFLHMCNGNGFVEDDEGIEVANAATARQKAIEGLRDVTASELRSGELNMASFIEIEDEDHQLVATVNFLEAVQVETRHGKRPGRWAAEAAGEI